LITAARSGDTLERILEVAEGEFAREGFAGAHLQSIAEQVGVQKTALYYYFPSKAALYLAVLARMLDTFDQTVRRAIESDASHREKLDRLLSALNELLAERKNYSQILIRIFVDRAEMDASTLKEPIERVVGRVLIFFREGVEGGAFRRLSPRHFFQTLLGATVFHYAARNFSAGVLGVGDVFNRDAVAWRGEQLRALVAHGVLPDEVGPPDPEGS
jgi:TetR/AcrR family transcriptional regulator